MRSPENEERDSDGETLDSEVDVDRDVFLTLDDNRSERSDRSVRRVGVHDCDVLSSTDDLRRSAEGIDDTIRASSDVGKKPC